MSSRIRGLFSHPAIEWARATQSVRWALDLQREIMVDEYEEVVAAFFPMRDS